MIVLIKIIEILATSKKMLVLDVDFLWIVSSEIHIIIFFFSFTCALVLNMIINDARKIYSRVKGEQVGIELTILTFMTSVYQLSHHRYDHLLTNFPFYFEFRAFL